MQKLPPKVSGVPLHAGMLVEVRTPGGGGYGLPERRLRASVADDLRSGVVSSEQAREVYGMDRPG